MTIDGTDSRMFLCLDDFTEFCRDFEMNLVNPKSGNWKAEKATVHDNTLKWILEEFNETDRGLSSDDLEEIVDGYGDLAFLAINGIYKTFRLEGFNHAEATRKTLIVLRRICVANSRKRQPDGTVLYKEGKVVKPEGWAAPTHSDLFDKEML